MKEKGQKSMTWVDRQPSAVLTSLTLVIAYSGIGQTFQLPWLMTLPETREKKFHDPVELKLGYNGIAGEPRVLGLLVWKPLFHIPQRIDQKLA